MLRGGEEPRKFGQKKRVRAAIYNKWFNNTLLITNRGAGSKRFALFKLFLPKAKSIKLAFLIANLL